MRWSWKLYNGVPTKKGFRGVSPKNLGVDNPTQRFGGREVTDCSKGGFVCCWLYLLTKRFRGRLESDGMGNRHISRNPFPFSTRHA